jgi:hypothetical protein
MAENIVEFPVQDTPAKKHVVRELSHRLGQRIFPGHRKPPFSVTSAILFCLALLFLLGLHLSVQTKLTRFTGPERDR